MLRDSHWSLSFGSPRRSRQCDFQGFRGCGATSEMKNCVKSPNLSLQRSFKGLSCLQRPFRGLPTLPWLAHSPIHLPILIPRSSVSQFPIRNASHTEKTTRKKHKQHRDSAPTQPDSKKIGKNGKLTVGIRFIGGWTAASCVVLAYSSVSKDKWLVLVIQGVKGAAQRDLGTGKCKDFWGGKGKFPWKMRQNRF